MLIILLRIQIIQILLIIKEYIYISNKYLINNSNKIKNGYLTENPNNYLNQEKININQMNNYDLNKNF